MVTYTKNPEIKAQWLPLDFAKDYLLQRQTASLWETVYSGNSLVFDQTASATHYKMRLIARDSCHSERISNIGTTIELQATIVNNEYAS